MKRILPSRCQLGERADDVLDRHVRIDAVLVEEVDDIGVEPLQRRLANGADVAGRTVGAARPAVLDPEAELGGDERLVAAIFKCAADELFVGIGAVDFGGVEEVDVKFERAVDGAQRLGLVDLAVHAGHARHSRHAHAAEPDRGNLGVPKFAAFHRFPFTLTDNRHKERDSAASASFRQ